jgi:hypothetical protein
VVYFEKKFWLRASTEIKFNLRRNYWSKLSKLIAISISLSESKFRHSIRNFALFQRKRLGNFDIDIKIQNRNRNSNVGIEILVPESKFRCQNPNQNRNYYFDIKISIKLWLNFVGILISSKVRDRNWNRNSDFNIENEISENRNFEISTKLG